MYEAHFGLKSNPFGMTPDPSAVYWTAIHREALAGLTYAIARRKGFVVLTGPAGTGKTTLIRKLLESSLVPMRTSIVYNPTLTPEEFLELALADFDMPRIPMNKAQRLLRLEDFLQTAHREEKVAVLIIDEAHKLSPQLLEEVRLLTNFETGKQKLLQILLVGQPELNGVLNREDLWQLKQRVAVRLQIQPLSTPDVPHYLRCRWMKAGGTDPIPFQENAIEVITSWSKGIPRVINGICDNALMSVYGAGRKLVTREDILEAVRDLDLQSGKKVEPIRVVSPSPNVAAVQPAIKRAPTKGSYMKEEDQGSLLGRLAGRFRIRRDGAAK